MMSFMLTFAAIEPLALSENVKMAVAVIYGLFLGVLLVKCGFDNRVEVKDNLTFKSMKMVRILLLASGAGMIVFALMRNFHVVQAHYPAPGLWGVLAGGIIMGVGLGMNGLVPITAVAALASGRVYALWSIIGMALALPAAAVIRNYCGSILEKFNTPLNNMFSSEGSFWSLENPALWVAAAALLLYGVIACFGSREN